MARSKNDRKLVEVSRKRVPLRKMLDGKEIRDAAAALEDFRLHLNEAEFLYGAKITLKMDSYGECIAIAKRLETDSEYATRLEKDRLAAEAKLERERKKALAAEQRAIREKELQKQRTLDHLKTIVKANGLTAKDLEDLMGN